MARWLIWRGDHAGRMKRPSCCVAKTGPARRNGVELYTPISQDVSVQAEIMMCAVIHDLTRATSARVTSMSAGSLPSSRSTQRARVLAESILFSERQ